MDGLSLISFIVVVIFFLVDEILGDVNFLKFDVECFVFY